MADPFAPRSMKRKNVKGLALTPAAPKPPPTAENRPDFDGAGDGTSKDGQLEIGIEYKLDLRPEDLEIVKELGSGNGGTVSKVKHLTTGTVMARKVIHVDAKKEMRRQIIRELQIMHNCHSDYIVNFYGAFLNSNNDVIMCMEYMDVGSLDRVSKVFGPVRVDVLGKIAEATLGGLTYLYTKHHIMHRDIKPSNILVNSRGSIKLCDFGVSGELINSIADTFVGTSTYMAPERIQGERYTVKSDVWSFGLSIMELAIGKFPFGSNEQLSDEDCAPAGILDLLQQIVHEPAPKLPKSDAFPSILEDMIQKCLFKEPERRPTPQDLFDRDAFVQAAKRTPVDLREWAVGMMERDNRKSHLAPQLSPSTQDLLRSSDSPTYNNGSDERKSHTPTSGEIPIGGAGIVTPRDHANGTGRSPSRNGYTSNAKPPVSAHPGLGPRYASESGHIPGGYTDTRGPASANAATFSLPVRPAPPSGPLPPAPVRRNTPDAPPRENRRQATFGLPPNPSSGYGV
ncbi:Dual specificity protein kinase FUZ7 [Beauveria bassiana]|uniref:MAP kinase kinase n=1 Tax=Beauveria bassiana (strain ARSEF 2860) TaxID=655819 RepID=J5JXF7_BEAB2|nr:MAP kinase kinase [Beauveria bassiana ARSEF 2860]EJP66961.1 MAP kinase kinase [Beauveria bassiana ARSEF 2860]KAF1732021.1 Dual specificity protein kinase FUZ7 [Beauveria bassiana]KAH8716279.1 Dual specificity protein kinase FUZ7 [Beauveria bassiana]